MIGAVILQIVLVCLNAVFACAELAVISANENKLELLAKQENKKAKRLCRLKEDPARFLATIQVAITLSGYLGSAFAADNFAGPLVELILSTGIAIPKGVLNSVCVVLITLLIAFFSIVFGELIPKRIAMTKTDEAALGLSGLLHTVSVLFRPVVWLLTASTNAVLRLLQIDPEAEETMTEEEIRLMVVAESKKGTIEQGENEIIQNVFEFNDVALDEICTHRMQVEGLRMEDSDQEWKDTVYRSSHSYLPVWGEDSDDVVGILNAKNYLRLEDYSRENVMQKAVERPLFVPETMKADDLFRTMKKNNTYFAVAIDEYGGMTGVVSMRDLMELLVGDLTESAEAESAKEIEQTAEDTWRIRGCASLDDVKEKLEEELPVDEYDTFGGFVLGVLGAVPDDGTDFDLEWNNLSIHVNDMQERCVVDALVKVSRRRAEKKL